jgi:8-oxo-dGTP pyrophosphatase MutT (NUDIX family)
MTTEESTSDEVLSLTSRSLASDYLIRITCDHSSSLENDNIQWELYPLSSLDTNAAMRALNTSDVNVKSDGNDSPVCTLSCCWSHEQDYELWPIDIIVKVEQMDEKKKDGIVTRELLCVLARIMIQSASSEIVRRSIDDGRRGVSGRTPLFVTLPLIEGEGCQKFHLSDFILSGYDCGVRRLFASMEDPTTTCYSEVELVDMVNQHGNVLGSLPRPFIHTYNILHRGIGMIVTKDENVFESLNAGRVPLVYVHRRTSTKRIFPSLYDMFVGGVSTRGEQSRLTAAREVAEELGLTRGLDILNGRIAVEKNYSPRRIIPVYCVHIAQSMCRVNVYVHVV